VADPLEIIGPRNGAAPLSYEIVESGTVDLQSVFARFDGSLASGPWRAALTIRAQNGTILGRVFPSDELAAGDSADVTFAPFLRGSTTSTPSGGGIQFDTDPQSGDWLVVETTDSVPSGTGAGYGIALRPSDGFNITTPNNVQVLATTGVGITASNGNVAIFAGGAGRTLSLTSNRVFATGLIDFVLASGKSFTVYASDAATKLFEVRDDATVHIQTGQTVQADL
jgi:hypothetical protein